MYEVIAPPPVYAGARRSRSPAVAGGRGHVRRRVRQRADERDAAAVGRAGLVRVHRQRPRRREAERRELAADDESLRRERDRRDEVVGAGRPGRVRRAGRERDGRDRRAEEARRDAGRSAAPRTADGAEDAARGTSSSPTARASRRCRPSCRRAAPAGSTTCAVAVPVSNAAAPPRATVPLTVVNGPPAYSSEPACASANTESLTFGFHGSGRRAAMRVGSARGEVVPGRRCPGSVVKQPPRYDASGRRRRARRRRCSAFGSQRLQVAEAVAAVGVERGDAVARDGRVADGGRAVERAARVDRSSPRRRARTPRRCARPGSRPVACRGSGRTPPAGRGTVLPVPTAVKSPPAYTREPGDRDHLDGVVRRSGSSSSGWPVVRSIAARLRAVRAAGCCRRPPTGTRRRGRAFVPDTASASTSPPTTGAKVVASPWRRRSPRGCRGRRW